MKRLLILLIILAASIWLGPLMNPQFRHMRQVDRHIDAIGDSWTAFKTQNHGFEEVRLFAYTGGGGTFGASGYVPTQKHVDTLRSFMASTNPPRPIFLSVRVYRPDEASKEEVR
ncbi:MAG: hypothetical protein CJBNEKGG_01037 [Prosthecobacter sp.]|nr:hypothetical protein [Prosthecobacter sp.]